eukprot:jgi/Mesvir1/23171/Mv22644-RA.1
MSVAIPYFAALSTYFSYIVLYLFGHARDFYRSFARHNKPPNGYAPIVRDFEDFYTRRLYKRIHDCWNRPICSAPDAWFDVMERELVDLRSRELRLTGTTRRCLNLGSYNYLGFAAHDEFCTDRVKDTVVKYGASMCTPRMDLTTDLLLDFERLVARYVGKEAAIVFGMGFATNSANIPMLIGKGGLIVSDALNHSSIVTGARASGAKVKVFQHNVPADLERLLRSSIAEGQPRTHRPWKKILVIVEGIYSMEGEVCRLPEIVAICKKYKAYIFLDEAHSIGALGRTGRGVCEHTGVDPANIDIMMGTFTKSFGSCGGYVAGDKGLIDYLRCNGPASIFATGMSPPAVQQALSALTVIMGEDGTDRVCIVILLGGWLGLHATQREHECRELFAV